MLNDEENKTPSDCWPKDINPTATYNPNIKSTVSIHTKIDSFKNKSRDKYFRKLIIRDETEEPAEEKEDFDIEYQVGMGGLGCVEAANQLCFDRRVAIKRVRSDRGSAFAQEHLKKEAQLMGKLEHSAIPPVHLVGVDNKDQIVLVMKFIQGNSWLEILKRDYQKINSKEKLPQWYVDKHLNYFLRIGEALEFAHKKEIIHRDIKPENVVIGDYGEVYLIDWGIACELDEEKFFRSHSYAGTPCYAAPEMIGASPCWDIRSDVYLMGATLFQIISGDPPHLGKESADVFEKIIQDPSPQLRENFSASLRSICNCAMSKDPDDRYSSVYAMLEDVRHFLTQGELSELYVEACSDLEKIKKMSQEEKGFSDDIEVVGSRCRYRLEEISYRWSENIKVKEKLKECLVILIDDAINKKRLAVARSLLRQYKDVVKKINLLDRSDEFWEKDANKRINNLADQLVSRSDELGTGIQVILVEELAAQKKAYKELREAYIALQKKNE